MFINKSKCIWENEPVKQELEDKINPRKRYVSPGGAVKLTARVRRPYTLRIRVKNAEKYIRSLTTDTRPNQVDLRGPTSADLVPKSVEPRVVWLDVRCELSEVNRVGARRILDCTEFGLSPNPVEQKHAMKGTETLSKESMNLSAGIKESRTEERGSCLDKPPSEHCQVKAGRLVMQVKIKSISTTYNNNEASKLPTSHSDVAFHSENRPSYAYKDRNLSSPNSPLYDMPPPSTLFQKRARRARRDLQLEQWRSNEDAKSRQERYKRRADRESEGAMTMKHIQWKEDLVEYFIIQEPDISILVKQFGRNREVEQLMCTRENMCSLPRILKLADSNQEKNPTLCELVKEVTESLKNEHIIALPTDTIYGIAALSQSTPAVQKLYEVKGRHQEKPIAICVGQVQDVEKWGKVTVSQELLRDLLPGPVTLVFERTRQLNPELNPGTHLVGIRIPDYEFVQQLAVACQEPLALTSANVSAAKSSLRIQEFSELWPSLDIVVDGGELGKNDKCRSGSTVVDLSVPGKFSVIRDGSAYHHTVNILKEKYGLRDSNR